MEELFDDNIKSLVAEIRSIVPLDFELHDQNNYAAIIKKIGGTGAPCRCVVWYYEPVNLAKIAHELYHMKIGLTLGDNSVMVDYANMDGISQMLFNKEFCSGFLNQCEHLLFYPLFHEQGYDDQYFFEEISPEKFEPTYNLLVEQGVKRQNGEFPLYNLSNYMKLLTLYMFFPIDNRFNNHKKALKRLEPEIYRMFNTFLNELKTIRIVPQDCNRLQSLYLLFRDNIAIWAKNHKIVLL